MIRTLGRTIRKFSTKEYGVYAGVKVPFVRSLDEATVKPEETDIWPAYRLIDNNGVPVDKKKKPHI